MKTTSLTMALAAALALVAMPAVAQDRAVSPPAGETAKPPAEAPTSRPSGSPQTGGDTKPSAVDPAEAAKTGANAGEGASYSRSNDKGDSALPRQDEHKPK